MTTTFAARTRQPARSVQSHSSSVLEKSATKPAAKPITLSKRLLFPHLPADADPPPLLTSSAAPPELDAELYNFIALSLRAWINPWWTKITRYDKEFLPEITRILTIVIRALETRLTSSDLSPLVFRDIPAILNQHYVDYRNVTVKLNTSYGSGGAATLPQLFHQLQPHMAVSEDGRIDEVYLRQAVDHILKECLPREDYEPETERYIIREIIIMVLVGSVVPRITQPWFIQKLIFDNLPAKENPSQPLESPQASDTDPSVPHPVLHKQQSSVSASFQSLAIFVLSAVQSISGVCLALLHAYKQARATIRRVNESTPKFPPRLAHNPSVGENIGQPDDLNVRNAGEVPIPTSTVPGALTEMQTLASPPPPSSLSRTTSFTSTASSQQRQVPLPTSAPPPPPNYVHAPLALFIMLISPPPSRSSPTSNALTSLAFAHVLFLTLTALTPFLSRLLPYLLYTHVLSPARILDTLRAARRTLFPEGWPAPAPVDPTLEEQAAIRESLNIRMLACIPTPIVPLLGPTPAARRHTIDAVLDPLSSRECNAHLIMFVLDLVLLTVFPELGVSESMGGSMAGRGETDSADASGEFTPPNSDGH